MTLFEKYSDTVMDMGKEVTGRIKGASEIAKLQYELKTEEINLTTAYKELGKKYYEEHKGTGEPDPELEEIEAVLNKIADIKANIDELTGSSTCEKCGAKIRKSDSFCPSCGAKVNNIFEDDED